MNDEWLVGCMSGGCVGGGRKDWQAGNEEVELMKTDNRAKEHEGFEEKKDLDWKRKDERERKGAVEVEQEGKEMMGN